MPFMKIESEHKKWIIRKTNSGGWWAMWPPGELFSIMSVPNFELAQLYFPRMVRRYQARQESRES